ncbi:hypothetical protein TI39_contig66g00004 [Zymoseptoria brevis]|uniref:BZIP domain-containing protein n=1 Tax=Zymoseptoria brevis TaxID=1047168 RepID=A0A0F4H1C3_9PEZI|nr:hypothetical protein TI39_contig66g00004 [Zymoseptoria brevis]
MAGRSAHVKTEQFDMDSFFDFNQGTNQQSPVSATASSSRNDMISPYEQEERQQFNGPSHDYGQFKQQVGLPAGSVANMQQMNYDGFNSGMSDMDFNSGFGYNSGLDMDADMSMDFNSTQPMPPMFFPANDSPMTNFVNPNSVGGHEEPHSNVGRLWPGMHSQQAQQAAMAKAAQAHSVQQRQRNLQAQQAQYRQAANPAQSQAPASRPQGNGHGKRASHTTEPHVEESISRLLNQMRQNSSMPSDDADSPSNMLPNIARMKKDEEEMDEDERLLASEEGKKLSSKERRQLRNKVSARAFRSRRKEYIGQLEGELAMKTQESNTLRNENTALHAENERYRTLIETLLRHPSFTPFINDISKDPSSLLQSVPPQQQQQMQQAPPQQQAPASQSQQQQQQSQQQQQQPQPDVKPAFLDFDASQLQIPQPQEQQQEHAGLAMIPEDSFNKLNLSGNLRNMNYSNFNSVNAYAVTDLPMGPDPHDLLFDSSSTAYDSMDASAICSASNPGLSLLLAKLDNAAQRVGGDGQSCL